MLTTLGGLNYGSYRQVKPLLVLTYVLLEGAAPRRQLAELLWPQARQPDLSLRVALHSLRECHPAVFTHEDPLQSGVDCDARRLLNGRGQAALELYAGPFLHGVRWPGVSAEFEEWALAQRERLAGHVQAELLAEAQRRDPAGAAQLAELAYRLAGAAPVDPERLRQLLRLSLPGSALEAELNAELAGFDPPPDHLPQAGRRPAPLLGRAAELDTLLAWALAEPGSGPAVALLSGPGGTGKSTLGRELLREVGGLGQRVWYVDAQGVTQLSELIARVLSAAAPGQALPDTWAGLQSALRGGGGGAGRALVFLDGADALTDLPELLGEGRSGLPGVRWLIAARRQRAGPDPAGADPGSAPVLALRLAGLETPEPDTGPADLIHFAAVQVFVREARRTVRDFAVTAENAACVSGLTRRLQGHPLALALAASWLRLEPLEAVYARTVREGAALHGADDLSPRGLALVAEQSWALLTEDERHALLRLSVFDDFGPPDALALGVPGTVLDRLLAHAFLEAHRPGSERLRISPALSSVVVRHAEAHPEELARARAEHARHYLAWLAAQPPAAPQLAQELGNVRRAVRAAVAAGTLDAPTLYRLLGYFDAGARSRSGTDLFQDLAEEAEACGAPSDVQAAAQIACMWLAQRADRLLDAQTLAARFLISPLADHPGHRMKALNTLASVRSLQGQWRVAADLFEAAYEVARTEGDQGRQAMYLTNLLGAVVKLDQTGRAARLLPVARELSRHGPAVGIGATLVWAQLELPDPEYPALIAEGQDLRAQAQASGDLTSELALTLYLGLAHLAAGQPRQALECAGLILRRAPQAGDHEPVTNALLLESRALYALGRAPQARVSARRALTLAREQRSVPNQIEGLLTVALDIMQERPGAVQRYLVALFGDARVMPSQLRRAEALLGGPPAPTAPLEVDEMTADLLRWLSSGSSTVQG